MNMEELEESIGELAATVQDSDGGVDDQILETMKTDFDGEIDCFIGLLGWAVLLSLSLTLNTFCVSCIRVAHGCRLLMQE